MPYKIKPAVSIKAALSFPGDKSVSHRAIILSSLARGTTMIKNFSFNDDSLATKSMLSALGVKIISFGNKVIKVFGNGLCGLEEPSKVLFAGSSGTTARLMLGVLSAQPFSSKIDGSSGLRRRPMDRVVFPLRMMGARFSGIKLPIHITGRPLTGIEYKLPVASAQVKSAVLLAGLFAERKTVVVEKVQSRDHTERMMKLFGISLSVTRGISRQGSRITLRPCEKEFKSAGVLRVPGDISSAAFFIAAASILDNSSLLLKDVSINPTRMGFVRVLKRMGALIKIKHGRGSKYFEPFADIKVQSSRLKGTVVPGSLVPSLIDELPVLMVCASYARGRTVIKGVGELRVKETDRVKSMMNNLKRMGVSVKVSGEDVIINGEGKVRGSCVKSYGDHRTAMSMLVAGLGADGETVIDDIKCINKSFPGFKEILEKAVIR